ncbi:Ig domain-containing protein [Armatimonas sp.]|uniref:Ig-like domain-containing protein n=1 Tax=Armatimonas sp. TaxID=1872638 RepID=UPI00374D87A6
MSVSPLSRRLFLASLALSLLLSGCGGGGKGDTSNSRATGAAEFTINWPETSRLIPTAAQSIKIALSGTASVERTVARPPVGTNQTTVTFNDLVIGNYTAAASAYPNADATGVVQATGSTTVTIVKNQTATGTLTMDTTITKVGITPATASIAIGGTQAVTGSAQDATNATVLTAPTKWTWSTSDATTATVSATGNPATVTGVKAGSVTITGTETESGKSSTMSITVNADKGNLDLTIK